MLYPASELILQNFEKLGIMINVADIMAVGGQTILIFHIFLFWEKMKKNALRVGKMGVKIANYSACRKTSGSKDE